MIIEDGRVYRNLAAKQRKELRALKRRVAELEAENRRLEQMRKDAFDHGYVTGREHADNDAECVEWS